MRRMSLSVAFVMALVALTFGQSQSGSGASWSMNGTTIEACSCKMFCQCYFNPEPTAHANHEGHASHKFCRFNNAIKVNRGQHGAVKLDGAKFWIAGDLGADFSKGQMDWAVLHFDAAVRPDQRKAIAEILPRLYPVKWNSFTVGQDAAMEWGHTKDRAVAKLDGGKIAEVVLVKPPSGMTDGQPITMTNLKYWGAPRNSGFVMMPNEVEAYRLGDKAYEFKGTNGFMITFDIDDKTAPPAAGTGME